MNINISQDGAGFSEKEHVFYSSGVETCSVYIFHGEKGYAMVHDTGQLSISSIIKLSKKCGKIQKAYFAINPRYSGYPIFNTHKDRRKKNK